MFTKLRVPLASFVVFAHLLAANASIGGELNDGMQLYFDGSFEAARQHLTALIRPGNTDARLHYFRGLASARLGDATAADRDFQKGAALEAAGVSVAVGQALQRVQGLDRLRLEKFRRMARLRARQRVQPVAPPPILPDNKVQLTIAVAPESSASPTFRLASEVPLRRAAQPDPFADDREGLLADEQPPNGPVVAEATRSEADAAQPVGTGIATPQAESTTASTGLDGESDAFAEDPFSDLDAQVAIPAKPSGKTSGIFGAVFRAIRKSTIPQLNPGAMLPPGMGPPPGGADEQPVNQFPEESFPQDDPFENSDDADELGGDEADPFGL